MRKTPAPILTIGYFVILLSLVRLIIIAPPALQLLGMIGNFTSDLVTILTLRLATLGITIGTIVVAYNLLSGKNWARIALMSLGSLNIGLVLVFTNAPMQVLQQIILYSAIAYFLFFDKKSDDFFKSERREKSVESYPL